jgi:hypothetical protein
MRREFSKPVKRAALIRADGRCEGRMAGDRCPCSLRRRWFAFDHDVPDWMGGPATLENCRVLCVTCHAEKTNKQDIPVIAKSRRIIDREHGIRHRRRIETRGFERADPQRTASRPIRRTGR